MLDFFARAFQNFFDGFASMGDWFAAFLIDLFAYLVGVVIDILFALFYAVLAVLPNMPEHDHSALTSFSALAFANNYIPITEIIALLPLLGTVFTGLGLYKLAKFVIPTAA